MKQSIQKKILKAFLIVLLVPILTALAFTEVGMLVLRNRSEDLLVSQTLRSSEIFVTGQSATIEKQMSDLMSSLNQTANYITYVYEHQDQFNPRPNLRPEECDLGATDPQFHWLPFSADAARNPAVVKEADMLTAWEPQFIGTYENNPMIVTLYIATTAGVNIGYDKNVADKVGLNAYSPVESGAQWYLTCMQNPDKVYISDTYSDVFGRGTMVTVAKSFSVNGKVYGVVGADLNLDSITQEILNVDVGKGAEMMLIANSGDVICAQSGQDDHSQLLGENADAALAEIIASNSGTSNSVVGGDEVRLIHSIIPTTGWRLVERLSLEEIAAPARESNRTILAINLMLVAAFVVITLVMLLLSRRFSGHIIRPLMQLNEGVKVVAAGNLDHYIDIHTGDEIETLADSFNKMTQDLTNQMINLKQVTAEKERIGAELDVAKHIQASMLPCIFPAFPERPELDIYATMTPAKEVGGDFYDFFLTDDDHLAMVMADVSGKGVPAALFMVIAKTLIKNVAQTGLSPKLVLEKVNNQLLENNEAEMFVTVWLGILEISTGIIRYANAGHEYPALKRAEGSYELILDKHGFVLAGVEGMRYKEYEFQMQPGDKLFLYTDGVAEAADINKQRYGTERLLEVLNCHKDARCEETLQQVKADIDHFVGKAPQFDDITMFGIELKKPEQAGLKKLMVKPTLEVIEQVNAFINDEMKAAEVPNKIAVQIKIALDEIFSNIVHYSYASDATVGISVENREICLRFADNGNPYDPTEKPDPDITLSADERDLGGLGIFMVKKNMDQVDYEYRDGLNILTLIKKIPM